MRRRKEFQKITEELQDIIDNTHMLANGNLDIELESDNYTVLKELADDICQISTAFNGYIDEISHILSHLSAGNMTVSFTKDMAYQGDFLPIKNALYRIRQTLNNSFDEINLLSDEVDQLCSSVENGATQIAENASNQAELINQLTDNIRQTVSKTEQNAANAKLAAKDVDQILTEAEVGKGFMDQMLVSIKQVQMSSKEISTFFDIIKGIADQTKLLALNASIEAARAGDMGLGFSVVAQEVGLLAAKSAEAVGQTTDMIQNSITTAEISANIAEQTAKSFQNIQTSISNATQLCTEIAQNSELQAKELMGTSGIIMDISGVVQNNAAFAQENSAMASKMTEVSSQLKSVMTRFRTNNQKKRNVEKNNEKNNENINEAVLQILLQQLTKVYEVSQINQLFLDAAEMQKEFECLYLIDSNGYQQSHTIMNPRINLKEEENFKPAMPGDYHGSKKYFRKALRKPNYWYTSHEYISAATGSLCKTISCAYENNNNTMFVLCVDLICSI